MELAHKKWAKSDENWRFGYQNKVRFSKKLSLIERGYFFRKLVKTCPKWFALPNFFISTPTVAQVKLAHKKWAKSDKKLTIWWPKQSSVFEKIKPHRAQIIFGKLVKTCPKWLAPPNFFYFILNSGWSETCPQKMTQIKPKLTIFCIKQSSMFEKVKPHRARILFWKSIKTCPKGFALPKFLLYHQLLLKWSLNTKNEPNRTKIYDLVTKTKFDVRKS